MIFVGLPTYNEARGVREVLCRASEALWKAKKEHESIVPAVSMGRTFSSRGKGGPGGAVRCRHTTP
jgi:hypothetical protein